MSLFIKGIKTTALAILVYISTYTSAAELLVGKYCPVSFEQENLGLLVFSKEWFHSGRHNASYIASDNATGIGIEIHFFASAKGHINATNTANCSRYRLLQSRQTNARLFFGESAYAIDAPDNFDDPFYDSSPLEHGYGSHQTPTDDKDKPWQGRHSRASTVAIYDTPYVSDSYGIEGNHITVEFETCAVCERENGYDTILSCGTWGYQRDYINEMHGWAEPEFLGVQCQSEPSEALQLALMQDRRFDYNFWIDWRIAKAY